jgi:hypothetical protein
MTGVRHSPTARLAQSRLVLPVYQRQGPDHRIEKCPPVRLKPGFEFRPACFWLKRIFYFGTLRQDFTCRMDFRLWNRNGDTQEGRGDGGGIHARAFVLAVEQNFQLHLQVGGFAVLFRGFECVHGRPVIPSEFTDEF